MKVATAQELRERLKKLDDYSHPYLGLTEAAEMLDVSRERMRRMVVGNQVEGSGPPKVENWYVYKSSVQARLVVRLEVLVEEGVDNE